MADIVSTTNTLQPRSTLLFAIIIASVAGFALGQAWPANQDFTTVQTAIPGEDWHGNVKRSTWPN
ncbi:MAG: hypothetical protein AAF625_00620 [Pseudomonadota bacterium]